MFAMSVWPLEASDRKNKACVPLVILSYAVLTCWSHVARSQATVVHVTVLFDRNAITRSRKSTLSGIKATECGRRRQPKGVKV